MAISGVSLATSLGINGGVCILFLIIFSILRVKPITRKFYMPRRFDSEVKNKPKRLPLGLFSWISPVMFYPEDEVLTVAGMDVAVMVRLLSYGWVLFAFCTFWCCALLMPINGTAGYLPSGKSPVGTSYTDIDLVSTSNVMPSDHRFWAHLGSVYIVSAVALWLLVAFSRDVSRLRARFMSTLARGGTSHSVLVTDIPCVDGVGAEEAGGVGKLAHSLGAQQGPGTEFKEELADAELGKTAAGGSPYEGYTAIEDDVLDPWADARKQLKSGTPDALVRNEMSTTYGADKVAAVNVVYNTSKVEPLLNKYNKTKGQLEDITDDYIGKIRRKEEIKKRKQVTLLPALASKWAQEKYNVGTSSKKVDALEYLPQELDQIYTEMKTERESVKDGYLPAAFVTFNDRASANSAATGLQTYDETAWRIQPAPGDDEIIWGNLAMRYKQRVIRGLAMWLVFIGILILYLPVTAAIQAVVNLDNVKSVPGLGKVASLPFVTQVLQGILPGLVLKIFLIVMPMILAAMAKFEGKVSVSAVDFSVVSRYFIFQVFATFIYQFLAGTALSNIQATIKLLQGPNPAGEIVSLVGLSAPQSASFFITFILISALAVGMGLLRLVPLIIYFIKNKLAGTERAKYRLWAKQPFSFGAQVANHTIIMLLGLAFTVLSPLIAPFCLLYFTLALLAQKYQLIYVVTLPYQASGRMWINCFGQIMAGIYALQILTMCVLVVQRFQLALLILPLIAVTAVVHKVNINLFRRPWTLMSLKEAAVLDARDHGGVSASELEAVRQKYLSPVFKVDEGEHAALIAQAGQVDRALKGEETLQLEDETPTQEDEA